MQARCLTLVTNACLLSTTNYLQDAIDAERTAGRIIHNDTLPHISPARWQHINFYLDISVAGDQRNNRAVARRYRAAR